MHRVHDRLDTMPCLHSPIGRLHQVAALMCRLQRAGNFSDTAVQGKLVHDMRYLASVVTNCFGAFGELLGMQVTAHLAGAAVSTFRQFIQGAQRCTQAPARCFDEPPPLCS